MTRLFTALVALAALASCAPIPDNVVVPAEAGRFARMTFALAPLKAFVALRDTLEGGTGSFLYLGAVGGTQGLSTIWQGAGGQTARVYFQIEAQAGDENATLVRVLTVPAAPPLPERLAKNLDDVGDEVDFRLGLQKHTLVPDR
jgi:hypothetical protein